MKVNPLIIYVEESGVGMGTHDNSHRNGLAYFLRNRYGCEVIVFDNDYYFRENLEKIKKLVEDGVLLLIIVKQEEYSNQHQQIITLTRGNLSSKLPIVVIPGVVGEERFKGVPDDNQVFAYYYGDNELFKLIEKLITSFKPLADQSIAIESQDRTLPQDLFPVSTPIYEQEMTKIRGMSEEEREEFSRHLYRAVGRELRDGGQYRVSFGINVYGFAIDPVTLEYLFTSGHGAHSIADDILVYRIKFIEELKIGDWLSQEKKRECEWRIMSGLVIPSIEGFVTSILIFTQNARQIVSESYPEHIARVLTFLKERRVFLPVTFDGNLIEG